MIPPHARRVFEGELFDVYQWDQELYDGTKVTFERAKRKKNTVIIIATTRDGRIVLVDEEQPHARRTTSLPGGRVEPGEELEDAARRELLEETGYEAGSMTLWKTYDRFPKTEWNLHYYVARDCRRIADPTPDAGERIEVRLLSFDDFLDELTADDRDDGAFTADMLRLRLDERARDAFRRAIFTREP